ncbi:hypothetical protein AMTRI_Chr11g149940 [Amborella trichopoda]
MEGAGSWDALDFIKIEPVSRTVMTHGMDEFLLEAEEVIFQGYGVVLVNMDEAGTLLVTNFRLLFVSEGSRKIIALGTIPLATIERFSKHVMKLSPTPRQPDRTPSRRLLQVIGKDLRIIVYGFRRRTKQRRSVFDALMKYTRPLRLWDLYTFTCGPSKFKGANPKLRLLNEYLRLLGMGSRHTSAIVAEDEVFDSNQWWRITGVNSNYKMCATYPSTLVVPKYISDEEVVQASSFRAKCRLPVISWCHPDTGAVLARSSQPLVGLMMNSRSNADEKLVAALCTRIAGNNGPKRKLYIADARPRKNALANGALGGGSESSSNYFQSEVVFFGIDNIHAMRDSFARLRDYLDTHGVTSSDGLSSFLRNGGWTWGGGNLSSMSASVSTLGDSGWLIHVQSVLAGSAWIAAHVALESSSVLVHCSDGWDRTTQLVSLASLFLDPYYRTFEGFQALVEKDWLAFGHPFSERMGLPSFSGNSNITAELSRQSSVGNIPSSPMRSSSGSTYTSTSGSSHAQISNNYSPIFSQWLDCVAQLLRMYPCAFEFSSVFLVDFLDSVLSCRFGNFLCNSEKERQQSEISDACGCLWTYLADLRATDGGYHHFNLFYDPEKHDGALLPPAAALAPTLSPQFHLRWACPSEVLGGDLEAQCRALAQKFEDMQKAKESVEERAKSVTTSMESLSKELMREKHFRTTAENLAAKAYKENVAIKRAIQSLGCKIQFSSCGDQALDKGNVHQGTRQFSTRGSNIGRELGRGERQEEKTDLSVSISVESENDDTSANLLRKTCDSMCPFRSDGVCKWPDAGCAQFGSQFLGLKANFDAFDQLSIYDCYFDSKE